MNEIHTIAGRGLRTVFIGEIVAIVSLLIPVLGVLGVLAGGILLLVGLYTASKAHDGFRTALAATVAALVVSLISQFTGDGFFGMVFSLLSSVMGLACVYLVCDTAAELVEGKGDYDLAQKGRFVWKLNLVCVVITTACTVVMFVPILNLFAALAALGVLIAALVGDVLYLIFLYQSSAYLGGR